MQKVCNVAFALKCFRDDVEVDQLESCVGSASYPYMWLVYGCGGKKSLYEAKLFAHKLEELSSLQCLSNRLCVFWEMTGETVVYSKQNLLEVYSRKKPQRPFACRNSKSVTWKPVMKNLYFSKIRYRVETVLFKYRRQQIFKSSIINGIKDRY